ncbi:MAG: molybdenum cofactor biosynthesis protein MoaE [Planctomycetota bacterium]
MIKLTRESLDPTAPLQQAQSRQSGAVLLFLGVTRQHTRGRETNELHYDAYDDMARNELQRLETEARDRWDLNECILVHRLGLVPLGEASVLIITASAHRKAAFDAGEWLIDTLKQRVPIWKQEHWADGTTDWVHPIEQATKSE